MQATEESVVTSGQPRDFCPVCAQQPIARVQSGQVNAILETGPRTTSDHDKTFVRGGVFGHLARSADVGCCDPDAVILRDDDK